MTFNGVMALILHYFTEFGSIREHCVKVVQDVIVKSSRFLSHLLMSVWLCMFRLLSMFNFTEK